MKEKAEKLVSFLKNRYAVKIEKHRKRNADVFQTLISCVLSQRTRDQNTAKASKRLFSMADTPEKIVKLPGKNLEKLIRSSGPYRQKAKRIKEISRIILGKYGGKIPRDREKLMSLPGVGFKTADITLSYGFGVPTIAVDVHVSVTANRLGIVYSKDVEMIRKGLESLIPEKDRYIVNIGLVEFGKEICRTRNPKCDICPISDICDYFK
jgi:endonuclease-3